MIRVFFTEKQIRTIVNIEVQFELAKLGFPRDGFSIVHHKDGSTDDSEIWKDYWEEHHPSHHFPSDPHICPSCLIERNKFVGGHVVSNGETYIVPVCKHCNDEFKGVKAEKHYFYLKTDDMVRAPED